MRINDFRYMNQGKQLRGLTQKELPLLEPVNQRGEGRQRALLLLHGFSSTPAVFKYLIPKITRYDALVCPVLPGHAQSIDEFAVSTSSQWLEAAEEACAQLCKEYEQVDILGLSLGGLLACKLAERYPIHHLFLLAPALALPTGVYPLLRLAKAVHFLGFRHLRNKAADLFSTEEADITYRTLPVSSIIQMLDLIHNNHWVPPTCPTDLFLGAHDKVVDSKKVENLFINRPNTNIHWLHNSAHILPLDLDRQVIVDSVNKEK